MVLPTHLTDHYTNFCPFWGETISSYLFIYIFEELILSRGELNSLLTPAPLHTNPLTLPFF